MDYLDDITIDRYKLEIELSRQSQKYMRWALKWADAVEEKEDLKAKLDNLRNTYELRIRKYPEDYDLDPSPKEGAIKAALSKIKKIKSMEAKYRAALSNERRLAEAKKGFDHRKKMLESLTTLNVQLHFAEPQEKNARESINQHKGKKVREALKKTKRSITRR